MPFTSGLEGGGPKLWLKKSHNLTPAVLSSTYSEFLLLMCSVQIDPRFYVVVFMLQFCLWGWHKEITSEHYTPPKYGEEVKKCDKTPSRAPF
jgi:hypothetical protein